MYIISTIYYLMFYDLNGLILPFSLLTIISYIVIKRKNTPTIPHLKLILGFILVSFGTVFLISILRDIFFSWGISFFSPSTYPTTIFGLLILSMSIICGALLIKNSKLINKSLYSKIMNNKKLILLVVLFVVSCSLFIITNYDCDPFYPRLICFFP